MRLLVNPTDFFLNFVDLKINFFSTMESCRGPIKVNLEDFVSPAFRYGTVPRQNIIIHR